MPSPKNRNDFLRCQMCKHCYDHKCRDMSQQTISLCKKYHWPTYDPSCPDWEETEDPNNWAKREFEHRRLDMLKCSADEIRKYQMEQKQIARERIDKIVEPAANWIIDDIRRRIASNPDIEDVYYDIEHDKIFYEEGMGHQVALIEMKYEPELTKVLIAGGFEVTCTRSKTDGKGQYRVSWYVTLKTREQQNPWKPSMR